MVVRLEVKTKWCRGCREYHDEVDFYNPKMSYCKKCTNEMSAESKRKEYERRRIIVEQTFGDTCHLCGEKSENEPNLHSKSGLKHENIYNMRKSQFEKVIENKEEFCPLCDRCHLIVHRLMDRGYFWREIEFRLLARQLPLF